MAKKRTRTWHDRRKEIEQWVEVSDVWNWSFLVFIPINSSSHWVLSSRQSPISSISQLFGLFRYFANDSQSRNFVNNFRESSPTFHSPRPLFYFHPLSHWIIDNNCHSPLYQWTSPRYIHIHIPVLDAFQISAKSKWELELCQGPTTLLQHNAQLLSSNNHISLSDL